MLLALSDAVTALSYVNHIKAISYYLVYHTKVISHHLMSTTKIRIRFGEQYLIDNNHVWRIAHAGRFRTEALHKFYLKVMLVPVWGWFNKVIVPYVPVIYYDTSRRCSFRLNILKLINTSYFSVYGYISFTNSHVFQTCAMCSRLFTRTLNSITCCTKLTLSLLPSKPQKFQTRLLSTLPSVEV